MWHSDYFSFDEMKCKCGCDEAPMDQEFIDKLSTLREMYDKPMIVSSGYRCLNHPIEAKKKTPGAHASGKAVDIAVDREEAYKVLKLAFQLGFERIGVQQKGSGRFIHLDTCKETDGFASPTVWSY